MLFQARSALPLLLALALSTAQAGTLVELSADASRPAANDLIRATVFAEANAADPAEVARKVNQDLNEALRVIKAKPGVTVKTGSQHTSPIYANTRKIDGWRMRAELQLESKDGAAISDLLARLQQMKLAIGNVTQLPSPDTRKQAEEAVLQDAIRAFESRAAIIGRTLDKSYKIKKLNIQQNGAVMPMPMLRAARAEMAADVAAVPLEGGESQISATVSGEIELAD
jgi:predicted secreted protein